jgi:hypothetical protein
MAMTARPGWGRARATLAMAGVLGVWLAAASPVAPRAATLPPRLDDRTFWTLSADLSEPNGYFRSDNLVSNEHTFQYVIPALQKQVRPGGVYLGVAPDQNFTYILATEPRMAFILDVRRGNLLEHLMFKAIFELSRDRAEFLSRLFARPRPSGLGPASSVRELFGAFDGVEGTEARYRENVRAMTRHLTGRHGFALSPDDLAQIEAIAFAFFSNGPGLRYSMSSGPGARGFRGNFPTYEALMEQTDTAGLPRGYLASETGFQVIKDLEARNLIVPVVGNFAGNRALRGIGRYVREHGATISAFYVSNVEQYLFQDGLFEAFAQNVATLPIDRASTFIRSVSTRFGYEGGQQIGPDGRASALYPIGAFGDDFRAGRLKTYYEVNFRSR